MLSFPIKDKQILSHSFNTHNTLINLGGLFFCTLSLLVGYFISYSMTYAALVMAALFGIVIIVRPEIGLYLMVLFIPLETVTILSESMTAIKLLGWVVLAGWILNTACTKTPIVFPREAWYIVVFIAWGLSSAFWAVDSTRVLHSLPTLIQLVGFYLMVINLVNSKDRIFNLVWFLIIGSVMAAGITILHLMQVPLGEIFGPLEKGGRIAIGSANHFSASLLLVIPFLYLYSIFGISIRLRFCFLVATGLILTSFFLGMSRGAVLGLIVIVVTIFIKYRRHIIRLSILVPAVVVIGLYFMPEKFWDRMVSGFTLADRGTGRLDVWMVGWNMILDNPLLGVGFSCFSDAFDTYHAMTRNLMTPLLPGYGSHSLYIGTVAELGIVGGVLLLSFLVGHLRSGYKAVRSSKENKDRLGEIIAFSAILSFLGLLVVGVSSDILLSKFFWMSMALTEAVGLITSNTHLTENKRIASLSRLNES